MITAPTSLAENTPHIVQSHTLDDEAIEVAHEALIREGSRLRDWLAEDRADLRIHRQLSSAAREWQRLGQDAGTR